MEMRDSLKHVKVKWNQTLIYSIAFGRKKGIETFIHASDFHLEIAW